MTNVQTFYRIPASSIIARDYSGSVDYVDCFRIKVKNSAGDSVDRFMTEFFTAWPAWIKSLFALRNLLVKPFGLVTGTKQDAPTGPLPGRYAVADRAALFTVIDRNASEIVMGEDDKHLYFRLSMLMEKAAADTFEQLSVTTLVKFHHLGGRFYFTLIKPFHKLIVKTMLANLARRYP